MTQQFKKLNTQLIGLSEDPEYVHEAWIRKLDKEIQKEGKPKRTVQFPIIADPDGKIARKYGMIHPNETKTQTVRAVFILDPDDIVRFIAFYPIANGRGFNEILRILEALQETYAKNVATHCRLGSRKAYLCKEKGS